VAELGQYSARTYKYHVLAEGQATGPSGHFLHHFQALTLDYSYLTVTTIIYPQISLT
jgi:hypothetical protein